MVIILLNPLFIVAGFIWVEEKIKKYVGQNKCIPVSANASHS
jgi:hypothetical protein